MLAVGTVCVIGRKTVGFHLLDSFVYGERMHHS
jgi:hypothetical protein